MKQFCLLLTIVTALYAQRQMTVAEVVGFVKSSVQQKLDDRSVADILKKTKLTEKLDERTVEELRTLGAGVRTTAALRELSTASASLPAPAAPAPKAPRTVLQAPDPADQKRMLAEITESALNYTQSLPNFISMQVTQRHIDPTGTGDHWQLQDRIREQLSYFEHKETYKVVMVNDQMVTNKEHTKLGGAVTSGEFGSMLYGIFAPASETEFAWNKWTTLDGRRLAVFSYRVQQSRSRYSIYHEGSQRTIIAGYHGLIYADPKTNMVMRITLECEEIPADFPVQDVKQDLNYDVTKIADQEFVLPLKVEMRSREGKYLIWNETDFRLYRKFGAEASITFDTADEKEEPPKPPVKKKQ
jgi:hypothetical protein